MSGNSADSGLYLTARRGFLPRVNIWWELGVRVDLTYLAYSGKFWGPIARVCVATFFNWDVAVLQIWCAARMCCATFRDFAGLLRFCQNCGQHRKASS